MFAHNLPRRLTVAKGVAYDGEHIYNAPQGIGKMTYPDGRVEEGEWKK
jgi:hypothetical protein